MKKGFTMIELIFVIVILGILAAVAIPRLAATRDDAEVSKAATNIQTLATDLGAYYTAQGHFNNTISVMTNVATPVKVKQEECLVIGAITNDTVGVTVHNNTGLCKKVWSMPGLIQLSDKIASDNKTFKFGGSNVNYN
ncbi:type II secretion system protein [uncultured Campylobacter sp.]|uniref:type II secretion system protein n=1 Tax=uncultured Campylobacter sp. TaxID=218934 RepID=UPI00261B6FE1|nr:prepilin-type N-terminal cleavage/methylation domain-containing protein [uncultured Campylobacter sp.]